MHDLFEDRFGRPGKGNDKGKVEGLVGYARRNFLVPIPVFDSFEALNAHLLACCRKRMSDRLRGNAETIGERLQRDLAALQKPLPHRTMLARRCPQPSPRCRWCATGATTTRCRPALGTVR